MATYTNSSGTTKNLCVRRYVDRILPGVGTVRELLIEQHLSITNGKTVTVTDESTAEKLELVQFDTDKQPPAATTTKPV